jgi:predicted ATPase/class 3 adenylate cyclase
MPDFPRGTVTFIFTDIEGSTRLWQDEPDAMARAYLRHDAILEDAIARNDGVRFKTIGDAFQIAFPTAAGAVSAAMHAQQALGAEPWELSVPLRVRMAIHSGAVDPDDRGDYRSPVLNRLGRLLGAGYGGQVLLSQTTTELCRDSLPAGAILRDLGDQRLKDLERQERVFQLAGPGLAAEFPALKTIDRHPNNLQTQPTAFVGRKTEVNDLCDRLKRDQVRLVTATGPGGIGKTRLCYQAAAELLEDFPDGVYVVELASVSDPGFLASAIATVLKLRDVSGKSYLETLIDHLGKTRTLLVLDNFEHIVSAAPVVSTILGECPNTKVLASSRARLRLRGEIDFPVQPLALPDTRSGAALHDLSQFDSVRLFADRAHDVNASFEITERNGAVIAELCNRLDGLPLAIELAASRIRSLPPEGLLKRLTTRLPLLTGGARDLPERQQTLRGAIQWSYELLTDAEQRLFRQLSVFSGGASLDAIESVAGDAQLTLFDDLERLVDHSLVRQIERSGDARYQMLETIREFGIEQLKELGEEDSTSERHAEHFARLADRYADVFGTDAYEEWIHALGKEHDNMRAALAWTLAHDDEVAFRILHAMGGYWQYECHLHEAITWYERAESSIHAPADRARILSHHAVMMQMQGEFVEASVHAREALELFRTTGNQQGVVSMLQLIGYAAHIEGDKAHSMALLREALDQARELGHPQELCEALNYCGFVLYLQSEYKEAKPILEEAVELSRTTLLDEGLSNVLHSLGEVCRADGDIEGAARAYREGLMSERKHSYAFGTVQLLGGVAILASEQRANAVAIRILGAEETHRTEMSLGVDPDVLRDYERVKTECRDRLGDEVYRRELGNGQVMTMEEVTSEALAFVDSLFATR